MHSVAYNVVATSVCGWCQHHSAYLNLMCLGVYHIPVYSAGDVEYDAFPEMRVLFENTGTCN